MTMARFSGPPMKTASSIRAKSLPPRARGQGLSVQRLVEALAAGGGVAGARVDVDLVDGQRGEARPHLVGHAGDPDVQVLEQIPGPSGAHRAGVDDRRARSPGERAVVGVADEEEQRLGAVLPVELL